MRKNIFNKKRNILLIMMLTTVLTFSGCGSKKETTTTEEIVSETETTEELTTESTEVVESEKETIELSAEEYYVDYPLSLDDGRQVYVKIAPLTSFYPEVVYSGGVSNSEVYTTQNRLITNLSADSGAVVTYEMDDGEYYFINWCKEWQDGWYYDVNEPENLDNGIVEYKVDAVYEDGFKTTLHALYYTLDDGSAILICIDGFLGTPSLLENGELPEEHEEILNFYRTEEDLFIVVDPEEVEVIVSDNTEVSSVEVSEESKQASNEAPITETVTTSQPSVETSQVNSVDNETYTPSDYTAPPASEGTQSTCSHAYGYGEINCMLCGAPHTHDWKIVVQTNTGVEVTPDEDFCCHSGWYFDTYEELRAHMEIPNVHGMVYLNDGSNGVTSVAPDYTGEVDFYACCHGWANCAGDGEGERIEYEVTQEVQFCKLCGVRGEATDIGERVILLHTYDD